MPLASCADVDNFHVYKYPALSLSWAEPWIHQQILQPHAGGLQRGMHPGQGKPTSVAELLTSAEMSDVTKICWVKALFRVRNEWIQNWILKSFQPTFHLEIAIPLAQVADMGGGGDKNLWLLAG